MPWLIKKHSSHFCQCSGIHVKFKDSAPVELMQIGMLAIECMDVLKYNRLDILLWILLVGNIADFGCLAGGGGGGGGCYEI